MARKLDLDTLLHGCADTSFDAGVRIDVELEPLAGDGGPVKPATYAGGSYQRDRRWDTPTAAEPTAVIVIDNVPSQGVAGVTTRPLFRVSPLQFKAQSSDQWRPWPPVQQLMVRLLPRKVMGHGVIHEITFCFLKLLSGEYAAVHHGRIHLIAWGVGKASATIGSLQAAAGI